MMDAKSAAHKSDAPTASRCENPNLRPPEPRRSRPPHRALSLSKGTA
jgi:hypothetical protein